MSTKPKIDVYVSVPDKRFGNVVQSSPGKYRDDDCKRLKAEIKSTEGLLKRWDDNKAFVTAQAKKSLEENLKNQRVRLAGVEAEIAASKKKS